MSRPKTVTHWRYGPCAWEPKQPDPHLVTCAACKMAIREKKLRDESPNYSPPEPDTSTDATSSLLDLATDIASSFTDSSSSDGFDGGGDSGGGGASEGY